MITAEIIMALDPIVESAIIGLIGVFVGIGGYAFQNWQVKKAERERAEYVIKRKKYEEWTKTFVDGWYHRTRTNTPIPDDLVLKINEANNMLMLYGSDDVVKAVINVWSSGPEPEAGKLLTLIQKVLLDMRKDLVKTGLNVADLQFLRVV